MVFILPLLMRLFTALSQVTENAYKVLLSDSLFFILKIILSYLLIYGVALFSIPPLGAIGAIVSHYHCTVVYVGRLLPVFLEKVHLY